jgi:hypothetical protein
MAIDPCLNPSCKSHGRPHPNCRCYAMAEGGEIKHHCASNNPHKPNCEFFAEGGQVPPINPSDDVQAALMHGGANMLFNSKGYNGAFGSKLSPLAQKDGTEAEVNHKRFTDSIGKGRKLAKDALSSLFSKEGFPTLPDHDNQALREHIKNNSGVAVANRPQPEDPLASSMPAHNLQLNIAKGRVGNYLNGLRPSEIQTKLPFDPPSPSKRSDRNYDKALEIANRPLHILKLAKEGRLTPQDVKSFSTMYPEMYEKVNQDVAQKVLEYQMEGKRPPHQLRQSLSLLTAAHLDSTVTPQSIVAAQAVFAPKSTPPSPATQGKNKKGTATLTKAADQYKTPEQKSQMRSNQ